MSDERPFEIDIEPSDGRAFGPSQRRQSESLDDMVDQLLEEYRDHAPTVALVEFVSVWADQDEGGWVRELHVLEPDDPTILPHPAVLLTEAAKVGMWAGAIVCYVGTATDLRTGDARPVKGVCLMVEGAWRSCVQVEGEDPITTSERPPGDIADAMAGLLQ